MKKNFGRALVALLGICLLPLGVDAETIVNSEEELLNALNNTSETEIVLGQDIDTTQKINITRDVTIDGQNHTIKYVGTFWERTGTAPDYVYTEVEDNKIWSMPEDKSGAIYVLQAYKSNVTIKDITLMGGNRAIGINGSVVTLDGNIILADNGFQPIELGRGESVSAVSTLKVSENTIIFNLDENAEGTQYPYTLYVDDATAKLVLINGTEETVVDLEEEQNLSTEDISVNLIYSIEDDEPVSGEFLAEIKNNNRNLVLMKFDENNNIVYGWGFEGSKLEDTNMDVNLKITFTETAPTELQENLSKFTEKLENVNYLNFEHDGKLPGVAGIYYQVGYKYAAGTKLYIAHYNEALNELETPMEVTVDEDGYIEFEISHCSSYVLYTGTVDAANNTSTNTSNEIKPAKTGDINMVVIISSIVLAVVGIAITGKKLATRR